MTDHNDPNEGHNDADELPPIYTPAQQAARDRFYANHTPSKFDADMLAYMDLGCPFCDAPPWTTCAHFTSQGDEVAQPTSYWN